MEAPKHTPGLGVFGHHPDPEIDFSIEADALIGEGYEVCVGLVSQWPFWGRLSRALRLGIRSRWFAQPALEETLRRLERAVVALDRHAVLALSKAEGS